MEEILIARSSLLSDSIEIRPFIDGAFEVALSRHRNRQQAFLQLAEYLNGYDCQPYIKRFIAVVERLTSTIESADYEEHASLLRLILEMSNQPDLLQSWNGIISSKLLPSIVRILNQLKQPKIVHFATSILCVLVSMRTRSILTTSSQSLINTIKQLLWRKVTKNHQDELVQRLVHLLALLHSLRPSNVWMDSFHVTVRDLRELSERSGLLTPTASTTSSAHETKDEGVLSSALITKIDSLSGVKKALFLKEAVQVQAALLTQMMKVGCSSGVVSFDATSFLPLAQEVLGFYGDVDVTDPAVYIEQENGLSRVDTALVSSAIKIEMLKCLTTFLHLNLPGLVRYGSFLLQPLVMLLMRKEVTLVPTLLDACLDCLSAAAVVLPNTLVILLKSSGAMSLLLSWFETHVNEITKARQHVTPLDTASDGSTPLGKRKLYKDVDAEFANDDATVKYLHFVEVLVLYSGHHLNATALSTIQRGLAKSVQCLEQGALVSGLYDKKFVRPFAHRLRHSAALQLSVLSLASAVLSITGGNKMTCLGSLQQVCSLLVTSSSSVEVKQEARKLSLLLGHLLHPSTIPLPPQSTTILAQEYVNSERKFYDEQKESQHMQQTQASDNERPQVELPASKRAKVSEATNQLQPSSITSSKNLRNEESSMGKTDEGETYLNAFSVEAQQKNTVKVPVLSTKKSVADSNTKEPEEMDEDIPDIDISSDIE